MKYIDYSGTPLQFAQIGTCPFRCASSGSMRPFACIVNGKFSVLFPCITNSNPQMSAGCVLYSWDGAGNMCTYKSANFTNGAVYTTLQPDQNAIQQSGNTFQFTFNDGSTYRFIVPTIFESGQTFTVPYKLLAIQSPCGAGAYHQTIFLDAQGLTANEYVQNFSLSSNYFASIFDKTGNLLAGGYIGNAQTDIFDQRNLSLPPGSTTADIYYKNNLVVAGTFNNAGTIAAQNFGYVDSFLNGDYKSLVCGGGGTPSVYVSSKNKVVVYPAAYGFPGFTQSSRTLAFGATDYVDNFIHPDYPYCNVISKDYLSRLYVGNDVFPALFCLLQNDGYMYKMGNVATAGQDQVIYKAAMPAISLNPLPVAAVLMYGNLANYHRAISPDGLFNA